MFNNQVGRSHDATMPYAQIPLARAGVDSLLLDVILVFQDFLKSKFLQPALSLSASAVVYGPVTGAFGLNAVQRHQRWGVAWDARRRLFTTKQGSHGRDRSGNDSKGGF